MKLSYRSSWYTLLFSALVLVVLQVCPTRSLNDRGKSLHSHHLGSCFLSLPALQRPCAAREMCLPLSGGCSEEVWSVTEALNNFS